MDTLILVIEIVLCLFSVFIVAVVLLQSGKSAGLPGEIAGGAETFLGKSKAKTYEKTLKKLTKISAVGIMILAVGLVLIEVYALPGTTTAPTPTASASAGPSALYNPSPSPSVTIEPTTAPSVEPTTAPSVSPTTAS